MKTIYWMFTGIFLLCFLPQEMNASDLKNKLKGKWEVKASQAPSGYQDYVMNVSLKDGNCLADISGSGINLKNRELIEKDGKLTVTVYIDEYVKVTIWEEKGVIRGNADTSEGKLSLTFKKIQ